MRRPAPVEVLAALPDATGDLVRALVGEAETRALPLYLVGGPVRDLLLGRAVADADLLVETEKPGDVAELARGVAPDGASLTTHPRFGTVTVRAGEAQVDLATVRRESYAHDGALPTVEKGTLVEDLQRRDFSVNALALPLSAQARARHTGVVDVDEGLRDLEQRRLRVLHARSFHDDPTRALRAARLAPRLSFSVTRGTRSALRDALRDGAFGRVSADRFRREIVKLFDDSAAGLDPARALRLLSDWHVLGALEPGLVLPAEAVAPLRRLGRAFASPPWRGARFRRWVAGLAVWMAPLAPALRRRALERFAVRGEAARRIAEFSASRDAWLRALARGRGRGATDAILRQLDEEELYALYAWAPPPVRRRIVRYAAEDRARRAPVRGDDLVALGLTGPAVGRALARIRASWLDGAVGTREEALVLAREVARGRAGRPRQAARSGKKADLKAKRPRSKAARSSKAPKPPKPPGPGSE